MQGIARLSSVVRPCVSTPRLTQAARARLDNATTYKPQRRSLFIGSIVIAMSGKSGVAEASGSAVEGVNLLSASAPPKLDVYVKGSPEKGELGDCPFSHRLMMTLIEKDIPFNKILVNELDIPSWVGDLFDGAKTVPFIFEYEKSKWQTDSDSIIPYIEDNYPGKKLGKPDDVTQVGSMIMPSLIEFLKSKPSDGAASGDSGTAATLHALEEQIGEVEAALQKSSGPYLGGSDVNAADLKIGPQLKHVIIGTKTLKNYTLPAKFKAVHTFMENMEQRPSWKQTYYTEEYVAEGWKKKMEKMGAL